MRDGKNKGFSLVELIIVIAIMAVLIGVLAPAYIQYVEKAKRTSDCTTISAVMDAVMVVAMDPDVDWEMNETISVQISTSALYVYSGTVTDVEATIQAIVAEEDAYLTSNWDSISFDAVRDSDGMISFVYSASGSTVTLDDIEKISPTLAKRFE